MRGNLYFKPVLNFTSTVKSVHYWKVITSIVYMYFCREIKKFLLLETLSIDVHQLGFYYSYYYRI